MIATIESELKVLAELLVLKLKGEHAVFMVHALIHVHVVVQVAEAHSDTPHCLPFLHLNLQGLYV